MRMVGYTAGVEERNMPKPVDPHFERVHLRLSREWKECINRAREQHGCDMSGYIRIALRSQLIADGELPPSVQAPKPPEPEKPNRPRGRPRKP